MRSSDILLIDEINSICRNFSGLDNKTKLNKFLDFFSEVYPDWIRIYNSRDEYTYGDTSEEIEAMLVSKIPERYTVDNFKETREFDARKVNVEFEKMARILHLSNKVAHGVKYMIGTYITNYFLDEAAAGNEVISGLLREITAADGETEIRVNDKFLDDFMKKFPFHIKADDTVKEALENYMEVDIKRDEIEERIQKAKDRINEVADDILDKQRSLVGDENFTDNFLYDYLKKLGLKKRLEKQYETDEISERDRYTLMNLQADRVALTNFVSEEVLVEVEELYLTNSELFAESEDLKMQKEDYIDRLYVATGEDYFFEFKIINNLRKAHGLSPKDMIRFIDMDLSSAKTAYDNCMEVKNKSIYNIHEYIVNNNMKYISYGISKDLRNRNNDDAEKNVFWIDVPGYSQFSVHFHPRVIENDLEKLEPMPDYEMVLDADGRREQVALLSKKSPAFRIFEKKYASDWSIDKEFGFDTMTRFPNYKKEQFRKMYAVLALDMGDDFSNRQEWLVRLGGDFNTITDQQRKILNYKVAEDRERRRAVRHQLGVMMGLSKDLLKHIYDFEELQYSQEFKDKMYGADTAQKRNEIKISLIFDKVLGRDKAKEKYERRGVFPNGRFGNNEPRSNHGYRRSQNKTYNQNYSRNYNGNQRNDRFRRDDSEESEYGD